MKLGIVNLGPIPVLFKPLRPFRLLARYQSWPPAVHAAAAPGDALYGAWLAACRRAAPAGLEVRVVAPGSQELEELSALLNRAGEGRVSQVWSADTLRRRLAATIDGYSYRVVVARRSGQLAGAVIYRLAVREHVIAGVIMELVAAADDPALLAALAWESERLMRAEGADTTLYLDGLPGNAGAVLRSTGHRTSNEPYQMVVWPRTMTPEGSAMAKLANWRFGFLDHDAF
jgi:hypothetical protein